MRNFLTSLFSIALLGLAAGCAREYIGEDPPTQQLHFPTGVAVSPVARTALVVSSNFDLGYNRGVVHSVDLARLDSLLDDAGGALDSPVEDLLEDAALVASFGGPIRFDDSGAHALMASRGDGTLLELELGEGRSLRCGDRGDSPQDCTAGDHVLQLSGSDPYSLQVETVDATHLRVYAGDLAGGTVDGVDIDLDASGDRRLTLPLQIDSELRRASGLSLMPAAGAASEYLLIAGQFQPESSDGRPAGAYLRIYDTALGANQQLGAVPLISANKAIDARAVAISPDGSTAYVAQRTPSSVAAIDLRPGAGGLPAFRAVTVQSVGLKPVALAVDADAAGGPQVLVVCFTERSLYALDGRTLQVRSVLADLGGSPADLALDPVTGRALITLFDRDSVAVVALDRPGHPGLERVALIGTPRPEPEESFTFDPLALF